MHIAHCLFTMETGGSQILTVELINELCREHTVSLIIVNNKYNESLIGQLNKKVQVHFMNRQEGSRNPIPLLRLNLLLARLSPDVIHCHEPNIARLIRLRRPKLLYTIHDTGLSSASYHLYDGLVAISDAVHRDVDTRYASAVKTVYNGVSAELFKQRRQHELDRNSAFRIVQVSRLMHEKKGQDILLQAVASLPGDLQVHVDLIGTGESISFLKYLTAELGLEDRVNFLGAKDRRWLFSHLGDYHLLVQPSRYEGFGLTVLEGLAAGIPVLASNIEGPAEIISRMPAGFLFEKEDAADCAVQIRSIIQEYRAGNMQTLINASLPVVSDRYSLRACAKGYLHQYHLLAGVQ